MTLPSTPDELLTTTRAVRRRLDLTRPVEPEVVRACLEIALQAPTASNRQDWRFVVITDPDLRRGLAQLYRRSFEQYRSSGSDAGSIGGDDPERSATQRRVVSSADHLAAHLHQVPVLLLPCIRRRVTNGGTSAQASLYASIVPATWSFMLAARARGLGTSWTTLHLRYEREAAELLGIPHAEVTQVALIPVAYTVGTDFQPAPRRPVEDVVHWNGWAG
jgi:nitroreductase